MCIFETAQQLLFGFGCLFIADCRKDDCDSRAFDITDSCKTIGNGVSPKMVQDLLPQARIRLANLEDACLAHISGVFFVLKNLVDTGFAWDLSTNFIFLKRDLRRPFDQPSSHSILLLPLSAVLSRSLLFPVLSDVPEHFE